MVHKHVFSIVCISGKRTRNVFMPFREAPSGALRKLFETFYERLTGAPRAQSSSRSFPNFLLNHLRQSLNVFNKTFCCGVAQNNKQNTAANSNLSNFYSEKKKEQKVKKSNLL